MENKKIEIPRELILEDFFKKELKEEIKKIKRLKTRGFKDG